jgi:tRNA(Ile)-lysidine synthase
MTFNTQKLENYLSDLIVKDKPARYVVGYSGGIDSTVLLHAINKMAGYTPVVAVHINHQLIPQAAEWEKHSRKFSESISVEFLSRKVIIDMNSGYGLEAASRKGRYDSFKQLIKKNDYLLTAHNQDDQVETVLLNIFRGCGLRGIRGIPASRKFFEGKLVRPLLRVSRDEISEYAKKYKLNWIEDPSNQYQKYDRNFLRHEILAQLKSRWPAVNNNVRKTSELASEINEELKEIAFIDAPLFYKNNQLDIRIIKNLSPARQKNILRYALLSLGLPLPSSIKLNQVINEVINARVDRQPLVQWSNVQIRRYRKKIYFLSEYFQPKKNNIEKIYLNGPNWKLGKGLGSLSLEKSDIGIKKSIAKEGFNVTFRAGGEKIKPLGSEYSRKVKKLFQEAAVVPWMRENIPLLLYEGNLVAVADMWLDKSYAADNGYIIRWNERPKIH